MANVYNGNTFYIDSASSAGTAASFVNEKDVLLEAIICSASSNGSVELCDLKYSNGAYSAGDIKLHLHIGANTTTMQYLDGQPIRFPNGIWVSSVSSTLTTLVLRRKG